jgi:hypothetical protein
MAKPQKSEKQEKKGSRNDDSQKQERPRNNKPEHI